MEVIKSYLDSMFSKVESTDETLRLKEEILQNMEDKYHDLRASGLSEHEAIGKVITEFGNIDEIIQAYHLQTRETQQTTYYPLLNEKDLNDYITNNIKSTLLTALGTFLMIASTSVFMTMQAILGEDSTVGDNIGTSVIIISIVIAIGFYIMASQFNDKPDNVAKGDYSLSKKIEKDLQNQLKQQEKANTYAIISGIALILIPIIPIIIVDNMNVASGLVDLTISGLLVCVASAVFLFIYFGGNLSMYKKILEAGLSAQADQKEIQEKERHKRINKLIDDIYWPIVSAIYFIWSFMTSTWATSWIIFIIGGIIEEIVRNIFGIKEE
ncbi:permease prefix domain 1-containing protein [Facklamia miroungae]|uniref:Beta-carotene 15,15'-monooxygenase n=1 Tax=Facklamia miroungae TaxID=120956 RepID=A0A1G7RS69_9LACT|nr:permease prefix domain 1-containing protein [Facklamia miroungae]NKZ29294.1 hypothetical protein [Facklamia miroungae]SDG13668.1 hypothetical protein SAMN05421791_103160 [Facklamia miroungae]